MIQICDVTFNLYCANEEELFDFLCDVREKVVNEVDSFTILPVNKKDRVKLDISCSRKCCCAIFEIYVEHNVEYDPVTHSIYTCLDEFDFTNWIEDFLPYINDDTMRLEMDDISSIDDEEELLTRLMDY
jgi:ferredoxin